VKLCHILGGNEEGGLELHFVTVCNRLCADHEVHVIAHKKYADRFDSRVRFHPVDLSRGRRNLWVLFSLYRTIRAIAPDIIHAHANKAAAMVASLRYLPSPQIKRVATLHSQKRKLDAFRHFDHVIGVSQRVLAPLQGVTKSVIYNGIDVPKVTYEREYLSTLGVKEGAFVVCAVGRLEKVKNFALLLHAVKGLDVELIVVGDGSQKASLQALAQRLHIEERVHFTGHRDDVPKLLYHSDLCVISSDREGFSYVMAEALLLERAVVSTDVGDMTHVLPQAYVVPVGDEVALRERICDVMQDKGAAYAQFRSSFAFAKAHFLVDTMIGKIEAVYDEVMKR